MSDLKKISIVIPVFNERANLPFLLNKVTGSNTLGLEKEIIIVDDLSTDGTRKILSGLAEDVNNSNNSNVYMKIFFQNYNQGKGSALKRGFIEATGDIILIQDGDLEYDPADYPALIEPLIRGKADAVYGSRFKKGKPEGIYYLNFMANSFLTRLSNLFTGLNLTDMETCYKVIRKDILDKLELKENRFGFEPEITAKLAQTGASIAEISISYKPRSFGEGKKISWKDGVQAILCIIKYSLLIIPLISPVQNRFFGI